MRETALAGGLSDDGDDLTGPADATRMRAIVAQHYDFIWRSLRRLGVDERAAEDAAQSVFVIASNKIGPVPADRERAFLFAVALRTASTHRRQKRRRPESASEHDDELAALASSEPGPDELIDRKKARVVMDALIEELPLEARTVFVLFEMEEYTMAQIAELLELAPGTVASRLRRARELFDAAVVRYQARSARGRAQ